MMTMVMISCNLCLFFLTRLICVIFGFEIYTNGCIEKGRKDEELKNDKLDNYIINMFDHLSTASIQWIL